MLKQEVMLEIKKGERIYQFHLPIDSPIGEVHDVMYEMKSYIVNRINESHKAEQPQEPQKAKEE